MNADKQYRMNLDEPDVEFLAKSGRQTGMKVPDGFFADFTQRMEAAIDAEEKQHLSIAPVKEQKPELTSRRRSLWIAAAACVAVAVCALPWLKDVTEQPAAEAIASDPVAVIEETDAEVEQEVLLCSSLSDYDMYQYYCDAL